ncbi:MAG: DUF4198 domain-containing protein [Planctomycetota bacterium]|nr:DUF4198 domain-containing protein [Planctomycetota bacterium]
MRPSLPLLSSVAACLAACSGGLSSAFAHEFWIQPSAFRAPANTPIDVSLMVGDGFPGEPVARNPPRIERFDAVSLGGPHHNASTPAPTETPIDGRPGAHPAGRVMLSSVGTHALVFRSNHATVELDATKFEAYLREEGLERIISIRRERGEADKPGREAYSRCAKALVIAGPAGGGSIEGNPDADSSDGAAKRHEVRDAPVGLTFELLLLSIDDENPASPGVTLRLRAMFAGKPLPEVSVCVRAAQQPGEKVCGVTNTSGEVSIDVAWTGTLMVSSVYMTAALPEIATRLGVDWESVWTSLTFALE